MIGCVDLIPSIFLNQFFQFQHFLHLSISQRNFKPIFTWFTDLLTNFQLLISVAAEDPKASCANAIVECPGKPNSHIRVNFTYVTTLQIADPDKKKNSLPKVVQSDPMKIFPDLHDKDANFQNNDVNDLIIPVPSIEKDVKDEKDRICSLSIKRLVDQSKKQLDACFKWMICSNLRWTTSCNGMYFNQQIKIPFIPQKQFCFIKISTCYRCNFFVTVTHLRWDHYQISLETFWNSLNYMYHRF